MQSCYKAFAMGSRTAPQRYSPSLSVRSAGQELGKAKEQRPLRHAQPRTLVRHGLVRGLEVLRGGHRLRTRGSTDSIAGTRNGTRQLGVPLCLLGSCMHVHMAPGLGCCCTCTCICLHTVQCEASRAAPTMVQPDPGGSRKCDRLHPASCCLQAGVRRHMRGCVMAGKSPMSRRHNRMGDTAVPSSTHLALVLAVLPEAPVSICHAWHLAAGKGAG